MNASDLPPRKPFLPRSVIPLLTLLFISGFLSLFVEGFFTRLIFSPAVQIANNYYRLYQSLPQNLVWAFVVVLSGLVATVLLWPRFAPGQPQNLPEVPHGRVSQLADLRARAEKSEYARWELAREIEKLALSLLAREYGETAVALQARIAHEEIPLPAALQGVFAAGRAIPSYRSFIEARRAAGGGLARYRPLRRGLARSPLAGNRPIAVLANLDLDAALAALASWEDQP